MVVGHVALVMRAPSDRVGQGLTQLQWLQLSYTKVTDAGLAHLDGLTQLHYLELADTEVTDAGLVHLEGLTQLQELVLYGSDGGDCQVTDAGVTNLHSALPYCHIS